MPRYVSPWVPMALGSVVARGAGKISKFSDSEYIKDLPPGPSTSVRTAMKRRTFSRTQTRTKRRRFRRRRRIRRMRMAQPYSIVRKMRTVKHVNLNPIAAALTLVQLKLNSTFDPHGSAGATQPLGFDQYSTLYKKSAVIGWSVELEIVTVDNSIPTKVGFTPMTQSSGLSAYEHYMELPSTVSTVMTPDIDKAHLRSRGGVKRWLLPPGGKLMTDDTLYVTNDTADPTRILYGHLWAQAMDSAADPSAVLITCVITQTVVFFDPKIPDRS